MAEDPEVDVIYAAPPHSFHEETATLCLNNKKAVLCEKPIAVNAVQTGRMIQCARKNNVFLMEAMWTRFLPAICKAREIIADGTIGRIRLLTADFGFRADLNPEGRLFAPALGGGSLLDVGVYNLSFSGMIFRKQPNRIQSHMVIGNTGVDEETSISLSYSEGQSALLFSAIRLDTAHNAVIYGDEGRIEIPSYWHGNKLKLITGKGTRELDFPFEASGYQFEVIEVMRCLDAGLIESPVMPLDESLAIMKIMDLIRKENKLRYPCDF